VKLHPILFLGTALSFSSSIAAAQSGDTAKMDPKMQKMMEAFQKYATPAEQHEALKKMAGTWTAAVKFWDDPKAPAQESTGTAVFKMVLGDRYLQEDYTGSMMGQPFTGMLFIGYDNAKKKYWSTWIDSMSTGIYRGEGTADKTGKVITFATEGTDPMTGKVKKGRDVITIESDTKHTLEMYGKGPAGGKEFKMMEIVYTKK
jgi:hypothetical protein